MAVNTITLTLKQYKCLREHLEAIDKIIGGKDLVGGVKTPKPEPKETKLQKINRYKKLIESGQRVKKPEHLKK
jgi:hypothetical protein